MKIWTLLLACCVVCLFYQASNATGFTNPLATMDVVQGFGGTHIGTDLDGNAGDAVYAIADGKVFYYRSNVSGYGGGGGEGCPAVNGSVIFIRHRKADGSYFIAQYGHIRNVPSDLRYTGFNFNGPSVAKGQQIAEIGIFNPCRDCGPRCDHLHFGIWNSNDKIPSNQWGYGPACWSTPVVGCWVNPITFLQNESPYAIYSCSWHTQDPNNIVTMHAGQTRTFTVSYTNTGTTTWQNTGGVSNPKYIELRSCNSSGTVVNSWLYPGAPPWINRQRVVSQNATNVQPGQNAWFIFTGRVPTTATPGDYHIYFRPYHATGGYIQIWDFRNFYIRVVGQGKIVSDEFVDIPKSFTLSQNYPNPFNPQTAISYSIAEPCHVTLTIYNILGEKAATLVDEQQEAGEYSINWDATNNASGIYFYCLKAGQSQEIKKMVLMK